MRGNERRKASDRTDFDVAEWRRYLRDWIARNREAGDPPERIARYERLLNDRTLDLIWIGLASDARNAPPWYGSFDALLQVVGTIGFPPSIIQPPTAEQAKPVLRALRILDRAWHDFPHFADHLAGAIGLTTGQLLRLPTSQADVKALIGAIEKIDWSKYHPGPLMSASPNSKTALRNWIALYVRDAIIPAFFFGRHDAAIAELIYAAYPEWPSFADGAKSVRELRERNLVKQRWGELVNRGGKMTP